MLKVISGIALALIFVGVAAFESNMIFGAVTSSVGMLILFTLSRLFYVEDL